MIISLVKSVDIKDIKLEVDKDNIRLPIGICFKGECIARATAEEALNLSGKFESAFQDYNLQMEGK